ncbi:hypothetical protein [Photobacterium sanctipauli]|uniref:hypothetical protein n=1 Tax=Photobacterium sanctipauli TaxID=1342794 RepID=UPI000B108ADF|nr:hypothetical protein [Photobacterium sanctipauli]
MSNRSFYSSSLADFFYTTASDIIGILTQRHTQQLENQQTQAWASQVQIIQRSLADLPTDNGHIFFEFMIPRMRRRADVVVTYAGIVFVIEFKVGATHYHQADVRQAHGYALDLKNFHRGSHHTPIIPILIATQAKAEVCNLELAHDQVAKPILSNGGDLATIVEYCAKQIQATRFDGKDWAHSGYLPTPTIVEAAQALYANHDVEDIARNEADTLNLGVTSNVLLELIHNART